MKYTMRLAFPGLMAALAEGATVITPTPLLASVAVEQFNRAQLAAGVEAWDRPDIYSLDAWMTSRWQQASFSIPNSPLLLSLSQERELWRQIIERDDVDLFDVGAMASIAQRAARVLAEYQIPAEGDAWFENLDAHRFIRWYRTFQQKLKSEHWITRADLWRLLPESVSSNQPVTFAALTTVSPGLKRLSRGLGDAVVHAGITPSREPQIAPAYVFESVSHEIEQAARMVRHLLETQPAVSIGLLVVDLKSHARELKRVLDEVLYPSSIPGDEVHIQGGPLSSQALISNALLFLELAQTRIHHSSAGAILRSPFIEGHSKERSLRAMADNRLRRKRELDFSYADIEASTASCPILQRAFRRLRAITSKIRELMRPPDWSGTFSNMLEALKWPGADNLTDIEQLAIDQWQAALSELASIGLVSPVITLNQALSRLRAILTRLTDHGSWTSPIQVLDASSVAGVEFDYTIVINGSDDAWPPPVLLSPLIPYQLQRLHRVPGSNPDAAAEERIRLTTSLFTSAAKVSVFFTGNLSPLIRSHTSPANAEPATWTGVIAKQAYASVELECRNDAHAPPLAITDKVRGGAGIVKAQSLCPFKAFAEYRLNARGEDEACFGFDALERGECAHKALEYVWKEIGTQRDLKALSRSELVAIIEKQVANAVADESANGPVRALTSLAERDRLVSVVLQWLTIDQERRDHFTVERLEETREVDFAGLKLSLRMDRVDRLANGKLLLIDYKSGAQSLKKLEGDRPTEPQLLVYAAAINEPIDGLYFAELRNRKAKPVGHGSTKHFAGQRSVKDHGRGWDPFLQTARDAVHRLTEEFKTGNAAVDPQVNACEYCKIKPVCRVGAATVADEDPE